MSFAERIADDLVSLGVSGDGVLVVHTAFSALGGRVGAPADLIGGLRMAAGPHGTVVMPTPCAGMGVVADTFWRMPGVIRSDSPHAFAAVGPHAAEITAPHPIDVPHGLDSPVGRAFDLDAEVLLLGIGHDANATVHLAETVAGVRYKIDHCCANFALLDSWLEDRGHQQRGFIGDAPARLISARDVVATALERLRENELIFLHPRGMCAECDEARNSMEQ